MKISNIVRVLIGFVVGAVLAGTGAAVGASAFQKPADPRWMSRPCFNATSNCFWTPDMGEHGIQGPAPHFKHVFRVYGEEKNVVGRVECVFFSQETKTDVDFCYNPSHFHVLNRHHSNNN